MPLKQIHWDLTSFHFTGEYENQNQKHIQILYTRNRPNEDAQKSVKIGLNVVKDEYGQVPIYYEDLDGKIQATAAVISNMENLKKHLKVDHILRISDRGGFSPEVAIKTKKKYGFDFISSIDFSKSYQDIFYNMVTSGIMWEKLSYLSINQQAKKEEKDRDYYYGCETKREVEYNGEKEEMRIIFIKSDGKLKRERKTESKRLTFINKGFEQINEKIGHPHYGTTKTIEKRIKSLLSKYPDYGKLYTYEIIQDEAGKPIKVIPYVNEDLLAKKRLLYGVYVIGTTLNKDEYPIDRVFSIFKEQYTVENANKILKGPVRLRPIFLHKQERIESLILVIFLALMLYYLLERTYYYRQQEEEKQKSKKDQKAFIKKTTARTLLWMFQWYSLVIIHTGDEEIVKPSELTEDQQRVFDILRLLSPSQWLLKDP